MVSLGDLGSKMREASPIALFFGHSRSPIPRSDRNTSTWFGPEQDPGRHLNHCSHKQSIPDGATLRVRLKPRLVELKIDRDAIDEESEKFTRKQELGDDEQAELSRRAGKLAILPAAPRRMGASLTAWSLASPTGSSRCA